jgi:hypothetical protein
MSAPLRRPETSTNVTSAPLADASRAALPPVAHLLASGGDLRIAVDSVFSRNKYGCAPVPETSVLAFGSATASTISPAGFAAVERLRARLERASAIEAEAVTYRREMARVRAELIDLCGLSDLVDLDVIFAASGTDVHVIAAQLFGGTAERRAVAVMLEAAETGSGVPLALRGRHFSGLAPFGGVESGTPAGAAMVATAAPVRGADGEPRPAAAIDREVEALVMAGVAAGRAVLINMVDGSKTGLIAPSPDCALALRNRFRGQVEVLVDACQFRIDPATLRAYLDRGFCVAVTGSKFITGPAFSGALLVPGEAAHKLRGRRLSNALRRYSARADWPDGWAAQSDLDDVANYGLLLRWEAALVELRAFCSLPPEAVRSFVETFATAIGQRLSADPAFAPVTLPPLDRGSFQTSGSWDNAPTIFPFLLRRPTSAAHPGWLGRGSTERVYNALRSGFDADGVIDDESASMRLVLPPCQLGQPINCGVRDGREVSALRLCLGMRSIVDAVSPDGRGQDAVIADAMLVLDAVAGLAGQFDCG